MFLTLVLLLFNSIVQNSDSEASPSNVGHPQDTLKETQPAQGHVRNRPDCPSPNRKRPRTCLAESGQMGARTNQRGKAIDSCGSVEEDGGRNEEDSKPSPVTSSSARTLSSFPKQEVVQQEEAAPGEIPSGWTRVKLEPDC
jgi:hypothetical protein